MSLRKADQVFPLSHKALTEPQLMNLIAHALKSDFGKQKSAIKRIGQITNVNLRTIKNWYGGQNMPSSRHLILLAQSSPTILKMILEHIGGEELLDTYLLLKNAVQETGEDERTSYHCRSVSVTHVSLNVPIKLNNRQKWFLIYLKKGEKVSAKSIVKKWQVTLKTARRDIKKLKCLGTIQFIGAKKTGFYAII